MSVKKIETATSLKAYLTDVFEEGIKSSLAQKALTEKEKQDKVGGSQQPEESSGDGVDDLFGGSSDESAGSGDDDDSNDDGQLSQPSKTVDDESEKLKNGEDITPKDVVNKLNSIRSGKSFKDSLVAKAMDEYINSLSKAEKVALLTFMSGIAQIVTGEIPGPEAMEPSDKPSDVQMQKGEPKDVKHIQPNVLKSPTVKPKQGSSEEDTRGPAPITPKKR